MYKRSHESVRGAADDTFAALQASFNAARRSRPPQLNDSGEFEGDRRIPLGKELHKRSSRFGLQGMFNRSKSTKITPDLVSPVLEEPPQVHEPSLERTTSKFTNPRPAPLPAATKFPTPSTKPINRPSRLNLRTKSVRENKSSSTASPKTKTPAKTPTRTTTVWDPPPLFQAYPQAIKHATLSASTMSADAILRISNHKRASSIVEDMVNAPLVKKMDKGKNKHKRQTSGTFTRAIWTQKIFVLVTSGYLLQYSGEGSFDRLPEKMMQLGKDSVAFASDVIPGKHWVLQISQAMDSDGTPSSDYRSLFSRLTFRGADYRRSATSLLLVLNSAEDLDSWIAVVRREIEALGGKKNVTETGKPKSDEIVPTLRDQPSHRYLVQREPEQFSAASSPQESSYSVPPWTNENLHPEKLVDAVSAINEIQSPSIRPSTSHHSMTSLSSHDGQQLESLRDSANRFSYMSSGQRTYPTSLSSSPTTSPTRDSFSTFDEQPRKLNFHDDIRSRPNALAINERRRSMQVLQNPVLESPLTTKFRPRSTCEIPKRTIRHETLSTPNFSVPNSAGKRFSINKSPSLNYGFPSPGIERPPVSPVVTTIPSRLREPALKGSRKAPPPALNMATQLSPVRDTISPKRMSNSPKAVTPTSAVSPHGLNSRRSMTIPKSPRFQPSMPSLANSSRPLSAYKPKGSPESPNPDFQFPRRSTTNHVPEITTPEKTGDHRRTQSATLKPPASASSPVPNHDSTTLSKGQYADSNSSRPPISPRFSAFPDIPANQGVRRPSSMMPSHPTAIASSQRTPKMSPRQGPRLSKVTITPSGTPNGNSIPVSTANPIHKLRLEAKSKDLTNRRSLPTLVNGPPSAPPPDCALPPLPPPTGSLPRPIRTSIRA